MPINKLIILRGNSGSGKTTTAKRLRDLGTRKIALIEQDNIRRHILREQDTDDAVNIAMIELIVRFALEQGYDVILEGILKFKHYGQMLERLRGVAGTTYTYYFDVSFEETLRRHNSKPSAHEFGAVEMKKWFVPHDVTSFPGERIIPESYSIEKTLEMITKECGMNVIDQR